MADDFRSNWDLVHDRVELSDPGPLEFDTAEILRLAGQIASTPIPDDDKQVETVAEIVALADGLRSESLRTRLEALWALDHKYGHWGTSRTSFPGAKGTWTKAFGPRGAEALESLRAEETELGRLAHQTLEGVKRHRRLLLGAIIGRFVLDGATERAAAGQLEFHDLLVLARRLLTEHPGIRRILHERYERLLLDEFQDTDPIQLEIAVRLTAAPDDPSQDASGTGPRAGSWRDLRPLPGRLFIVGDPKQSIYRFRRADISQYLRASEQVGADNVQLSANFRSTRAVIDFANDVFGRLITYEADAQPAFQALDACRPNPLLDHGTVTLLGIERHDDLVANQRNAEIGSADALRLREATEVAAAVSTALADGWLVFDETLGALRPCRPGDICILLPTRISLPSLEAELRRAGLAYRAENSSVVYATTEIRQLRWRFALRTTRPTRWRSSRRCAVPCTDAATSSCGNGRPAAARGTCGRCHRRTWSTIRSPMPLPTSGRSPNEWGPRRRPICSPRSPTNAAPSTSRWQVPTPETSGAACAS